MGSFWDTLFDPLFHGFDGPSYLYESSLILWDHFYPGPVRKWPKMAQKWPIFGVPPRFWGRGVKVLPLFVAKSGGPKKGQKVSHFLTPSAPKLRSFLREPLMISESSVQKGSPKMTPFLDTPQKVHFYGLSHFWTPGSKIHGFEPLFDPFLTHPK